MYCQVWVSTMASDTYPPSDGRRVILTDTDHLWGAGGNYRWACPAGATELDDRGVELIDDQVCIRCGECEAARP